MMSTETSYLWEEEWIDGYLHRKVIYAGAVMRVEVKLNGIWMTPLEALALRNAGQPWLRTYDGKEA